MKDMVIANFNADPGQMWKWFAIPGTNASVELKLVLTDEMIAFSKSSDMAVQRRYAAKNLFRDFKGMKDCNGVAIPNDEDNRTAMLCFRSLWIFVLDKLQSLEGWMEEGKGDSGSAS